MRIWQILSQKQQHGSTLHSAMQRVFVCLPLSCDSLSYHLRKYRRKCFKDSRMVWPHWCSSFWQWTIPAIEHGFFPTREVGNPIQHPQRLPTWTSGQYETSLQPPAASDPWPLSLQHSFWDLVSMASSYFLLVFHGVSFLIYSSKSVAILNSVPIIKYMKKHASVYSSFPRQREIHVVTSCVWIKLSLIQHPVLVSPWLL